MVYRQPLNSSLNSRAPQAARVWNYNQQIVTFLYTAIECHKLVLSSASSYFSQLLSAHSSNMIDVTLLPENVLTTAVAFM